MMLLNLFLLSWVVSSFASIISEFIPEKNVLLIIIKMMLSCSKCSTFWFVLAYTLNPLTAATISFVMFIYKIIEDKYLSVTL